MLSRTPPWMIGTLMSVSYFIINNEGYNRAGEGGESTQTLQASPLPTAAPCLTQCLRQTVAAGPLDCFGASAYG